MAYFKVAHLLICLFWHVVTSPRLRNFFSMALPSRGFFFDSQCAAKDKFKEEKKIEISTTMAINYFPTNHGLSDTRIALWQFSTDHSSYSIAIEWEEEIYCVILFFFIFSFSFSSNASRDFFVHLRSKWMRIILAMSAQWRLTEVIFIELEPWKLWQAFWDFLNKFLIKFCGFN